MLVIVLVAGMLMVAPTAANAYLTTGCSWPGDPVKWQWAHTPPDGNHSTALTTAMQGWSNQTQVNISPSSNYNIRVWAQNYGNTDWSGQAPDSFICSFGMSEGVSKVLLNTYYTNGMTQSGVTGLAYHEAGHALGLAHVGTSTTACASVTIMNHYTGRRHQCGVYAPKSDDIAGMNAVY